jgi:6-pyruvoyltetrahydropterin/6-carboxytetrahydropterin synthase
VTVRGTVDPQKGFFINLDTLKQIIDREVVDLLDHSNMNSDIEFFQHHRPTCENTARWIWNRLCDQMEGCELYRVRLFETNNNYAEYFGDEDEEAC